MKKIIITSIIFFSSLVFAEHSWYNYHWKTNEGIADIPFIESLTPFWQAEYAESILKWNQSSVLNVTTESSDSSITTRQTCPFQSGHVRVCNYEYGATGWLGLASVGVDNTGHVDRAVARLNDSYPSYWTSQNSKNHVMCHEIGHTFGLGHTSEDGSSQGTCMDYSGSPASQWPNAHDYEQLVEIYGHPHNDPGGPDPTKCKGNDKDCDGTPDNGGKGNGKGKNKFDVDDVLVAPAGIRVFGNEQSNHEVWVAPRGDGGIWINYVWLVDEEDREDREESNLFGLGEEEDEDGVQ